MIYNTLNLNSVGRELVNMHYLYYYFKRFVNSIPFVNPVGRIGSSSDHNYKHSLIYQFYIIVFNYISDDGPMRLKQL